MIDVLIPLPPSTNQLYLNVPRRGRVKTERYRKWIAAAGWELIIQRPKPIIGRYRMVIELPRMRGRADPSNRVKAIEDLFVSHRLIEDDSQKYTAGPELRASDRTDWYVRIVVTPAE